MTLPAIAFLDLKAAYLELKPEIDAAVERVLGSGWYILGEEVDAFEAEYADYCGARHCVGVANGLDALHLALRALDLGPGDEVIVPSNTYIATWLAVSQCGATPIPVEPDPRTHNLDPERIAAAVTPRTRVLMPVHLYGQPVDLDPILALAAQHSLCVVEDAAQAHGARYRGRRIGAHGHVVAWSFYPGKNLGAFGDAGALTTDDTALAERLRVLRNYGSRVKYVNDEAGWNSRLDPLQAAALRVKLRHLDAWNARRRALAAAYDDALSGLDLVRPATLPGAESAWHLYVVQVEHRDEVMRALAANGIGSLIHYPIPPHRQQAYAAMNRGEGSYPIAERLAAHVLSLPIGPQLDPEAVPRVADVLRRVLR